MPPLRVYVFGGRTGEGTVADTSQLAVFDTRNNSWMTQQQPTGPGPSPRSSHRTVCYGNSIVLFGGAGGEDSTQRLNDMYVLLDRGAAAAGGGAGVAGQANLEWVAAGEQAVAGELEATMGAVAGDTYALQVRLLLHGHMCNLLPSTPPGLSILRPDGKYSQYLDAKDTRRKKGA
jgi:hypothetical protein